MSETRIPLRNEIADSDKWDLSSLFPSDESWNQGLEKLSTMIPSIDTFRGTLDRSPEALAACLNFMTEFEILAEAVGSYAMLQYNADGGDSLNQQRYGKYFAVASRGEAASSYLVPEIQAIDPEKMKVFMESPLLADYRIYLEKLLRFKPHVLSEKEEKLMSLRMEADMTAHKAFSALTDVDMEFGSICEGGVDRPLSQSSFTSFLMSSDREIRKKAYFQFYEGFDRHKNTISALYAGNIHLDIFKARARNYGSSLEASLFPDKVPVSVYDNLIAAVRRNFPVLHRYYELKRKALGVERIAHYDVYSHFVPACDMRHTYDEAVNEIINALAPLGDDYCQVLKDGLLHGWVDRYENKGKRSGAFSAGCYTGKPYILMNFQEDRIRDLFTLAHEGGHSMHSYYSVKSNCFKNYDYTIFEAETASTFNEQMVAHYLIDKYRDQPEMLLYLAGKQADDFVATVFRQTMFAEFEKIVHEKGEAGEPLTLDLFRSVYRQLLSDYFGPDVELFAVSDLEGLRIPHFYRAFYVYKYATGLSAAVALSDKVLQDGESACLKYREFLKSGGTRYPLDSLRMAGVDMSTPEPVLSAINAFSRELDIIENLI